MEARIDERYIWNCFRVINLARIGWIAGNLRRKIWQSAAKLVTLDRKVQRLHGVLSVERNTWSASDYLLVEDIVHALLKNRENMEMFKGFQHNAIARDLLMKRTLKNGKSLQFIYTGRTNAELIGSSFIQ